MPVLNARRGVVAALVPAAIASGCAVSSAAPAQTTTPPATRRAAPVAYQARRQTAIDRLTAVARRRYATEVHGGVAFGTLHRVGRDPVLLQTLRSGNLAATRAYVQREYRPVWYHWHVSRVRILKGSRVVVDAGVPFVVAPVRMTLRDHGGRALGTLEVSIQDEIGFVRFMHRNYPVDVVVRGRGAKHVQTSLPAAASARLPANGVATISGQRYSVRQFHAAALGGEPVTVSILTRG
jgi:hypothetical protein